MFLILTVQLSRMEHSSEQTHKRPGQNLRGPGRFKGRGDAQHQTRKSPGLKLELCKFLRRNLQIPHNGRHYCKGDWRLCNNPALVPGIVIGTFHSLFHWIWILILQSLHNHPHFTAKNLGLTGFKKGVQGATISKGLSRNQIYICLNSMTMLFLRDRQKQNYLGRRQCAPGLYIRRQGSIPGFKSS